MALPAGCQCHVDWFDHNNSEGFVWYYNPSCPISAASHDSVWRTDFISAIKHGGAVSAGSGAMIINGDGMVSVSPFLKF